MKKNPNQNRLQRIIHVITGLDYGGAEIMLSKLVVQMQNQEIDTHVVSLGAFGPIGDDLHSKGFSLYAIGIKRGKIPTIRQLFMLAKILRAIDADLIQGWMYHGNLAATLGRYLCRGNPKVIWNIRQSFGGMGHENILTRKVIKIGALLSNIPDFIIYNSRSSARQHEKLGYRRSKSVFIPNGFELDAFSPKHSDRESLVQELLLEHSTYLVTHVARFHPKKDHKNFLVAASIVLEARKDVRFLLAGKEVSDSNVSMFETVKELNLDHYVRLLGERTDIPRILASSDLFVNSSAWGEGFPNAIGEAMASGVPCTVTKVGESATIVGDTGWVVDPEEPGKLASAILELLSMTQREQSMLRLNARKRIVNNYSIGSITQMYLDLYRS